MGTKSWGPGNTLVGGFYRLAPSSTPNYQREILTGYGGLSSADSPGPPYTQQNAFRKTETLNVPPRYTSPPGQVNNVYSQWYLEPTGNPSYVNNSWFEIGIASTWVTKALANVNPSKPEVSIANFLWELREFPGMLKDLGRILSGGHKPSDIPGSHLAWQFGWGPLFQDLSTLMNLAQAIEQSQARFARAKETKRMSGTLANDSEEHVFSRVYSFGHLQRSIRVSRRVWFTAHWERRDDVPTFPTGNMLSMYANALGLNQPLSSIWQAIPWSFLIDYFINVGDYLEATEGLYANKPAVVCIMQYQEARLIRDVLSPSDGGSFVPGRYSCHTKGRRVDRDPKARISFNPLPLLGHLGVLSSLVTAGALRRMGS